MGDKASHDAGHTRQLAQGQNCFPLDGVCHNFFYGEVQTCYGLISILYCVVLSLLFVTVTRQTCYALVANIIDISGWFIYLNIPVTLQRWL